MPICCIFLVVTYVTIFCQTTVEIILAKCSREYPSVLYRDYMTNNVVGDPVDGRSEMTPSLSTEGGGGGIRRGWKVVPRINHRVRGNGCFSLLSTWLLQCRRRWKLTVCMLQLNKAHKKNKGKKHCSSTSF